MEATRPDMLVSATRPKQPYPGLRPFEPEEWSIFFGRESMVDDVIERLAAQRVVLIHGASGSGKSSLVRAGVLPRLARQHLRHGVNWLTCAMRPSGGPLWNLAREFARLEGRENDLDRIGHIIRLFNKRGATLASVVGSIEGLANKRLCILVDQFEELFRFERETSREEAELFVELLIGEITSDDTDAPDNVTSIHPRNSDIHIAITMRSEFLGECARFSGFAEAINRTQYLVPRMKYKALLYAIRRPAELYGGEVTIELAERLVADVRGREDELPLIQHGLMLLWNAAAAASRDGTIRLDVKQFEHTGGLTQLLSDHANRVMSAATSSARPSIAIERLFRALTDINAEGRAIRRPQRFGELVAICEIPASDLRGIIDVFRAEGVSLLTPFLPATIEDKTVIDISHEALIRCWNRIADPQNGWLRREFQDGLIWRSLLNDAKEFEIDRKHILAPAATTQRIRWLAEKNPPWSKRYGGNWNIVANLLQISRQKATRSTRLRWLLLTPVIWLAALAAAFLVGGADSKIFDLFSNVTAIVWLFLLVSLVIDYSRLFIPSERVRTWLVWGTFFLAAFVFLVVKSVDASPLTKGIAGFSFAIAGVIAAIWVGLTFGPTLLRRYLPGWKIPQPLIRMLGIGPPIRIDRPADPSVSLNS